MRSNVRGVSCRNRGRWTEGLVVAKQKIQGAGRRPVPLEFLLARLNLLYFKFGFILGKKFVTT